MLQDLRIRAMRLATKFTRQESQDSSRLEVSRQSVELALKKLATEGIDQPVNSELPMGSFPFDAHMYLEKRLNAFKMFTIRWATRVARERSGNDQRAPEIEVADFDAAWKIVSTSPVLPMILVDDKTVAA